MVGSVRGGLGPVGRDGGRLHISYQVELVWVLGVLVQRERMCSGVSWGILELPSWVHVVQEAS